MKSKIVHNRYIFTLLWQTVKVNKRVAKKYNNKTIIIIKKENRRQFCPYYNQYRYRILHRVYDAWIFDNVGMIIHKY